MRRLKRLVLDLLDVRRLQNGGFSLELERVALDQVAAQTVEAAQTMTTELTIRLERPNTPIFVAGDAARLEQVLLNLLTNAITYAPHSEFIDVRLRRAGGEAELRVRDYGAGIPATDLPHIFSRFYQVERGNDRPSAVGWGLASTSRTSWWWRTAGASKSRPSKGRARSTARPSPSTCRWRPMKRRTSQKSGGVQSSATHDIQGLSMVPIRAGRVRVRAGGLRGHRPSRRGCTRRPAPSAREHAQALTRHHTAPCDITRHYATSQGFARGRRSSHRPCWGKDYPRHSCREPANSNSRQFGITRHHWHPSPRAERGRG